MDSEENETSCSACREINGDPIRIACGHSFCLKCLQQVAGNNEKFPCPLCRFDVDLTLTNVDKLLKNVVFCNIIEARDTKEPSMCLDHNKSFDLFCQGCDAVICYKCLLMHHKGHAIEDIEIIFIERNKQLGAFLESTKHLASMAQDKCDAVKQSRISMEKNIDSISKTVENTFTKWNDALQKQQNVIFSYLHQERDQKRQVFVEAEHILAGSMTTVTRLDTDINNLRSKDAVFVVQQYGSIKARQEDTERKVLQEIETCFEPPDNLAIEVCAPWIEEAIQNIKHIDMKQAQATPGRQTIAEIQEEKVILKSDINELQNKILGMGILMAALDEYVTSKTTNISLDIPNDIQLDPRFVLEHGQAKRIAQEFEKKERETRQLQVENKYLKLILDDLHKSIIVGEAALQMELQPPEDIKNDKLLMELTTNTRKINLKFYELETELDYIHRTISQLTSMIVGDDRSKDQTQEKTNKFTATGRQPKRNPAKKFEQREQSSKIDKDIELLTSVWKNLKEKEVSQNEVTPVQGNTTEVPEREESEGRQRKTNEVENLEYFNQCLDGLIQYLHDHVVSGAESSPRTITQPAEIKPESSIAKRYQHAKDICAQFTKVENEYKELQEKTLVQGILMAALDEYVTTKKPNISFDIPNDIQLDQRFVLEHGQAKRIAQEFEKKERQLLGFKKVMEEKAEEYQQKLAKQEKSKTEVVTKLKKTEQTLNEKSVTLKILQATHKTLQSDYTKVIREKSLLEETNRKIQYSISCLQQEKDDMNGTYQRMIGKQNHEITRLRVAEVTLLTRLRKIAGDPFLHDIVNIADLSDADRPTKLSETYSELYDNEWTDAFEELTEDMKLSDEAAIRFLLKILMNAFYKCKEITWDRYESLKLVASTLDVKQEKLSSMITEEKQPPNANISDGTTTGQHEDQNEGAGTTSSNPTTSELLCANLLTCLGKPETEMPKTSKYLTCCTELCWKMGVQEKPMHLDVNAEKEIGQEKQFDTDKFRAYTKTGKSVAYVVWPALLLHEGGAMLAKGIAQGCQKRVSFKE